MAQFTIEFDRSIDGGPQYDPYNINQSIQCNDDGQQRRVRFNDTINGDFVVGYNYFSPGGYTAQTIKILGYEDTMIWTEIATGAETVPTGFVPSRLRRNSTSAILTYPYTMNISDLADIGLEINSIELICNESDKYETSRSRAISYTITDANGQEGPVRKALYTNSQA